MSLRVLRHRLTDAWNVTNPVRAAAPAAEKVPPELLAADLEEVSS